jgi:hypothetical protein
MRKIALGLVVALVAISAAHTAPGQDWSFNGTTIEACTCPMFCQCYFNTKPAGHHTHEGGEKHYCKFNMAYKINKGHYGKTALDGAKFWVSGDLGGDFGTGQTDWAVVTFDKKTTPQQREAIGAILGHVFPVKWGSLQTAEGSIDKWEITPTGAHATLDGGKTAEVKLSQPATKMNAGKPAVLHNVKYFAAARNDGFIMMPNEVQAYRVGEKAFESKGTNGFLITIDMNSRDVKPAKGGMVGGR